MNKILSEKPLLNTINGVIVLAFIVWLTHEIAGPIIDFQLYKEITLYLIILFDLIWLGSITLSFRVLIKNHKNLAQIILLGGFFAGMFGSGITSYELGYFPMFIIFLYWIVGSIILLGVLIYKTLRYISNTKS